MCGLCPRRCLFPVRCLGDAAAATVVIMSMTTGGLDGAVGEVFDPMLVWLEAGV